MAKKKGSTRSKKLPDKSKVKVLGPEVGYVELINHGTDELIANNKTNFGMPLRPSASGKCEKELGFEFMEFRGYNSYEKPSMDANVHRLLSLGHAIESNFIWNIRQAMKQVDDSFRIKYSQQVLGFGKLESGETLEGSVDSVFISDHYKALIDYKSKKNKWSSYYKDNWEEIGEALRDNPYCIEFGIESYYIFDLDGYLEHTRASDPFTAMNFYQLNLYFHDENDFLQSRGVDHCALLYYNKNDSRIREIRFKPSKKVADYVKKKFNKVQKTVDKDKSVDNLTREFSLGSVKCAFCDFRSNCYKHADALQEYFNKFPNKKWPIDTKKLKKKGLEKELESLYNDYITASENSSELTVLESTIVKLMHENRIYKIRFSDGNIYELKTYKTGGIANGPRMVLKRSKL